MSTRAEKLAGWLAQVSEPAIEPELPVIDTHHHLWPTSPFPQFEAWGVDDTLDYKSNCGHNIIATVHIQAHACYWDHGPEELRCVGETQFVEQAAQAAEKMGGRASGFCAGIDWPL